MSIKTLELKQKVKTLEENNKSLNHNCSKLIERTNESLNQIKEFGEHDKKSLSPCVQGKEGELGSSFEDTQPSTYKRKTKDAFEKRKK